MAHVDANKEIARVVPVISAIVSRVRIPISIDTSKAEVAEAALASGASIVNDVRGLTCDPELGAVVARRNAPLVLMHDVAPDGDGDRPGGRGQSRHLLGAPGFEISAHDIHDGLLRGCPAQVCAPTKTN